MTALRDGGPAVAPSAAPRSVDLTAARRILTDMGSDRVHLLAQAVAVLAAFLLGLHLVVHGGVGVGDLFAPLLLAVWVPTLGRYHGAWLIVVIGLVAAAWGWWMGSGAMADGYALDPSWRLQTVAELASVVTGAGVLLWARTVVSTSVLGAAFGMGMVVNAALLAAPSDNPWKFTWAVPVSLVVLSAATWTRRTSVEIGALVLLALVSALLDCRSYSAALALTLLLLLAMKRPGGSVRHLPTAVVAGFVVALAGAVYYLGTSLLVSGYLGRDAQVRTVEQIDSSGSVILGGRPEISATWQLLLHRPWGYGAGVVPQGHDIMVAKTGLRGIGYDPNNGYVEKYMFGGHIELHSVFGDLWSSFGAPGLVFTALVALIMLRSIATFLARRTGDCLVVFPCVWTLWNVGFSPFGSSSAIMTLGLAVALTQRRSRARTATAPVGSTDQPTNTASRRAELSATAAPSEHGASPRSR